MARTDPYMTVLERPPISEGGRYYCWSCHRSAIEGGPYEIEALVVEIKPQGEWRTFVPVCCPTCKTGRIIRLVQIDD
jgi:hypothetical protein